MDNHSTPLDARLARLPRSMQPTRDLWTDIASRIEAEQVSAPRRTWMMPTLAAVASVAFVAIAVTFFIRSDSIAPVGIDSVDLARSQSQRGLILAGHVDLQYSGALRSLAHAVNAQENDRSELGEIELSLRTLQRATEDIRAALEENPDAEYLAALLESTHRQRVELLKNLAMAGPQTYETQSS